MTFDKESHSYDDIINLPNPTSAKHPRMSPKARAAQFAPFAALVGHDEAIKETARLTDRRLQLGSEEISELNKQLAFMKEQLKTDTVFKVTYFVPDEHKQGGRYVTHSGRVRWLDEVNRIIFFDDKTEVDIDEVVTILK